MLAYECDFMLTTSLFTNNVYEFQFNLYIKWLTTSMCKAEKNCYSNSSLEGVIFAPWKSCIKCYRKWRFLMRKFLVLLILQQAT